MTKETACSFQLPFIGSWELIIVKNIPVNDPTKIEPAPYWKGGKGVLVYTDNGYFSVQLMKPNRPKFNTEVRTKWKDREITPDFEGYVAYYGAYQVHNESKSVHHQVTGALVPDWIGMVEKRKFEFSDNFKTLTLITENAYPMPTGTFYALLEWRRLDSVAPFSLNPVPVPNFIGPFVL